MFCVSGIDIIYHESKNEKKTIHTVVSAARTGVIKAPRPRMINKRV